MPTKDKFDSFCKRVVEWTFRPMRREYIAAGASIERIQTADDALFEDILRNPKIQELYDCWYSLESAALVSGEPQSFENFMIMVSRSKVMSISQDRRWAEGGDLRQIFFQKVMEWLLMRDGHDISGLDLSQSGIRCALNMHERSDEIVERMQRFSDGEYERWLRVVELERMHGEIPDFDAFMEAALRTAK